MEGPKAMLELHIVKYVTITSGRSIDYAIIESPSAVT